jgi:cytochrome c553
MTRDQLSNPCDPKRRNAKVAGAILAALMLPAVYFSATARSQGGDRPSVSRSEFAAKMDYCQVCHGPSAQGYRGFYPMPRLAGQQPEYLKNQMQAFAEHRRTNNIMFNVAHTLSPAMINALAERFYDLDPRPIGGAARHLVAAGRKIFEDGVPDANVAACTACHGPNATGRAEFPRLAGQLNTYVIKVLTNWRSERGQITARPDTSMIMKPIAHSLTRSQIEAVAAYVSTLR